MFDFTVMLYVAMVTIVPFFFLILKFCYKACNNPDTQSSSLTTSQVQAQQEDFLPHYVPARVNTNELPPPYYQ
ncbi:hypothetical protein CONCODRAFT_78841 [Conidiobolus coronatus NRRL 28638]|uniref:Uncharacterized protein n=1 Tax=Conidiobolus coronatus (strain ATCC 28846 / CBS 209.66 / NRRL 28638) TaxID=796925 RepID=A0A137P647_CONC2|nr:hypothetical protein CONCODRAFT_78841 [Conidiobolus coronatus NRRL 28638]|eukprot:KXN70477.1 hypothetical protein CONCODRAFT_78841 [Conidiobolus coronatus NRRL 28638]